MKVTRINVVDHTVVGFACDVFPFVAKPDSPRAVVFVPESSRDEELLCEFVGRFAAPIELQNVGIEFTELEN